MNASSSSSFSSIYIECLQKILEHGELVSDSDPFLELPNLTFELSNPRDRIVWLKSKEVNYAFAMKLFIWVTNGCSDSKYLENVNPNSKRYKAKTSDTFMTAYGPRFAEQFSNAVSELKSNAYSRRASIMILKAEDQQWLGQRVTEYPCLIGMTFSIRNNKLLMYVSMRSNNMFNTVIYDVWLLTMIQEQLLYELKDAYPDLELGSYYHSAQSAHIYCRDLDSVSELVNESPKAIGIVRK